MESNRSGLTEEECRRLLEAIDPTANVGVRNLVMILLMLEAGLKVGELVGKESSSNVIGGLRLKDIDFEARTLTIRKLRDGSTRRVGLSFGAAELLRAWTEQRPDSATDLVFTTMAGGRIANRYVRRMLNDLGRKAGIALPVKPSLLRKTFGNRVFEQTGSVDVLRERLGLAHVATTFRYATGYRPVRFSGLDEE